MGLPSDFVRKGLLLLRGTSALSSASAATPSPNAVMVMYATDFLMRMMQGLPAQLSRCRHALAGHVPAYCPPRVAGRTKRPRLAPDTGGAVLRILARPRRLARASVRPLTGGKRAPRRGPRPIARRARAAPRARPAASNRALPWGTTPPGAVGRARVDRGSRRCNRQARTPRKPRRSSTLQVSSCV